MWALWVIAVLFLTVGSVGEGWAEDAIGTRPLLTIARKDLHTILPSDSHILIDPYSIEQFLDALDGNPTDWGLVYGHGHQDPDHDERLFTLNRDRDAKREGKEALQWTVVFLWSADLSRYDPTTGGFSLAIGPIFTPTRWGVVRFKPEEVPSNLVVIPNPSTREVLRRQLDAGRKIGIEIAMVGRLIPDESLVYDFSHDEKGLGIIMPVVRIERVEYLMVR
ncbi:MAG: glycosyltransferase family 4 protein [Nitrospirae bacterium]|nr:MAG: glycosyltransferase family 4 protein [Nitrospirota bacterium]